MPFDAAGCSVERDGACASYLFATLHLAMSGIADPSPRSALPRRRAGRCAGVGRGRNQ
jgi:hypothetical protein